ncbi:MAG: peptidoglycan editing factor PgeF [Acidobacteriota bacterium]
MFYESTCADPSYFAFQELEEIPGFVHAFTSRRTDSALERAKDVEVVLKKPYLLNRLKVRPQQLVLLNQIHSDRVLSLDQRVANVSALVGAEPADGVVLERPGLYAAIRTADCLPILAVMPEQRKVCLLHAGWRGTRDHIVAKGIRRLLEQSRATPTSLIVALGPSIRRCCYRVGPELLTQFQQAHHPIARIFHNGYLDLVEANLADLESVGIEHALDSGMCTSCRADLFYSYRRNQDRRRMWAVAGFRDDGRGTKFHATL